MVQLSTFTIVFTSVLSTLVAAKSCKTGGIYCGKDLLARGDYITKVITNLKANNLPPDNQHEQQSLWACTEHGDITFLQMCAAGCIGGTGEDDYCTEDKAAEAAAGAKRDIALPFVA